VFFGADGQRGPPLYRTPSSTIDPFRFTSPASIAVYSSRSRSSLPRLFFHLTLYGKAFAHCRIAWAGASRRYSNRAIGQIAFLLASVLARFREPDVRLTTLYYTPAS